MKNRRIRIIQDGKEIITSKPLKKKVKMRNEPITQKNLDLLIESKRNKLTKKKKGVRVKLDNIIKGLSSE